jgi:hypothetical protein
MTLPNNSGNRALPVRKTSLAFQAGFLPASRIAIYAKRTSNEQESYFSSPYSLLFSPQRNSLPAVIPAAVTPRTKLFLYPTGEPARRDQEAHIKASRYRDSYRFSLNRTSSSAQ